MNEDKGKSPSSRNIDFYFKKAQIATQTRGYTNELYFYLI
jgi:hypothetical protein